MIIRALNAENAKALFDNSTTPSHLAELYRNALAEIGMEIDVQGLLLFESQAATIINMIMRNADNYTDIARWIVYNRSPFFDIDGNGVGSDFALNENIYIASELEEFLFRQNILSLFYISLPSLPSKKDIWSVINSQARSMLEQREVNSLLRLPLLGAEISYNNFLFVASIVLVFLLALFAAAQNELDNHQDKLLKRQRLLVFPRLMSQRNPLDLDVRLGSNFTSRAVWAAFLIAPLSILSFATLFRYDASSIGIISISAIVEFSPYQSRMATLFDIINLFSLLITMFILKQLVEKRSTFCCKAELTRSRVLLLLNILILIFIMSSIFINVYHVYGFSSIITLDYWLYLFQSPRIYVYGVYITMWITFCWRRFGGNASEFFLVAGVAINGATAISLA